MNKTTTCLYEQFTYKHTHENSTHHNKTPTKHRKHQNIYIYIARRSYKHRQKKQQQQQHRHKQHKQKTQNTNKTNRNIQNSSNYKHTKKHTDNKPNNNKNKQTHLQKTAQRT